MGPQPSAAIRHRELVLHPEDREACGAGISWVRQALADWYPSADGGDVVLVAAELLSNAARHGRGPVRVVLDHGEGALRVAVSDASPVRPRLREHRPDSIGGHGLFIIDQLAVRWGCRPEGAGKTVWADLPPPSPSDR
ncbi:ATP-binding protein [Streptomyces sp. NPDC012888]|uniref:ATP-binding protein n=1 Tax=Streptomyces sp. NPDC012888 TaxID=3364855 RepID=UPI0036C3CB56